MKKNEVKVPFLIMILLLALISCQKDKVNDSADADVYVKSVFNDGEPVFGLVQYVFGYSAMSSVLVQSPGGMTDQLSAYNTGKTTYYSEPSIGLGTYSGTPPTPGAYVYDVTFEDGIGKSYTNELGADYLLPPSITSITKSTGSQSVTMIWEPLTGAEYFQLSILKDATTLYTSNPFTPPSGNTIDIPLSFIPSYTPGVYTYQLDAVIYESDGSGKIQAVSSASVSIEI